MATPSSSALHLEIAVRTHPQRVPSTHFPEQNQAIEYECRLGQLRLREVLREMHGAFSRQRLGP